MDNTITTISLFSGVGMLDQAVGLALGRRGIEHRVAAYCEWESSAASALLARMEEQSLDPAPIFCADLADFPAESFAGRIDGITAGYPCQPFSCAGTQRGLEDPRAMGIDGNGPIEQMLRIIGCIRPRFVFLENVPQALRYFRPIGQRLESYGFTVAPPIIIAAEDTGASHKRERVFTLAFTERARFEGLRADARKLADTERKRLPIADSGGKQAPPAQAGTGEEHGLERPSAAIYAPDRDPAGWEGVPEYLQPATEPDVCRMVDGVAYNVDLSRADQLRQIGNGVVAIQGAAALELLIRSIEKRPVICSSQCNQIVIR